MKLVQVVAVSENGVIGKEGEIPWHLSEDLKHFQSLTKGFPVIMGRLTYESILKRSGKPLSERHSYVLSSKVTPLKQEPSVTWVQDLQLALDLIEADGEEMAFVIGGERVYSETLHLCERVEYTLVHQDVEEGDAFYPDHRLEEWEMGVRKTGAQCSYLTYHNPAFRVETE